MFSYSLEQELNVVNFLLAFLRNQIVREQFVSLLFLYTRYKNIKSLVVKPHIWNQVVTLPDPRPPMFTAVYTWICLWHLKDGLILFQRTSDSGRTSRFIAHLSPRSQLITVGSSPAWNFWEAKQLHRCTVTAQNIWPAVYWDEGGWGRIHYVRPTHTPDYYHPHNKGTRH